MASTEANSVASVEANGDLIVKGELLGRVKGFAFSLDSGLQPGDVKLAINTAHKALLAEMPERVALLERDNDGSFLLSDRGELAWRGVPIGKLTRGDSLLKPLAELYNSEFLDSPMRERVRLRLQAWLDRHLRAQLKPLFVLMDSRLDALARGLAFQLCEEYACLSRNGVRELVKNLPKELRRDLSSLGVRIGRDFVFIPSMMRPRPSRLRALLWGCWNGAAISALPDLESTAFDPGDDFGEDFCRAVGYNLITNRKGKRLALRVDVQERISHEAYKLLRGGVGKKKSKTDTKQPVATAGDSSLEEFTSPEGINAQASSVEVNPVKISATGGDQSSGDTTTEGTSKEGLETTSDDSAILVARARSAGAPSEIPKDSFQISGAMRDMSKLEDTQLAFVLKSLRFHPARLKGGITVFRRSSPQKAREGGNRPQGKEGSHRSKRQGKERVRVSDSPFAILQKLKTEG